MKSALMTRFITPWHAGATRLEIVCKGNPNPPFEENCDVADRVTESVDSNCSYKIRHGLRFPCVKIGPDVPNQDRITTPSS